MLARARASRVVILAALSGLAIAAPARAQTLGWSEEVEGNASLFFGSRDEWHVTGHAAAGRADSTLEVRGDFRIGYAESTTDDGRRVVSARDWRGSLNLDALPYGRWSPFVLGSAESNLQLRVRRRYNAGAGAKYTVARDTSSEVSLSLAALWEHTASYDGQPIPGLPTSRARWSARFRLQHRLNDHLRLTHVTFYQPRVDDVGRFTVNTTTKLLIDLVHPLALTATLQDTYDSEATQRGARSNNDGQLLLGVRAEL